MLKEEDVEEIGNIAEREISLNKFKFELKIKKVIFMVSYLILSFVELIYFKYFKYWFFSPLLLCLIWFLLLIFNTNLYHYLFKNILYRFLIILITSILNIMTVLSLIIIYEINFGEMDNFDYSKNYFFKLIIIFNILWLFSFFCIDINIINYNEYIVYPLKIIFFGIIHHETYQIEEINGKWITKQYIFHDSLNLYNDQQHIQQINKKKNKFFKTEPIGIWQKIIIICFIFGMLGTIIFTINGIQQMQS